MRRAGLAVLLAFSLAACKSKKVEVRQTVEEVPRPRSSVHVSDLKASAQLVNGFYQLESNSWRWTARQFTVALGPPVGAAQKGALLKLELTVPQVTIDKLKTISLTASVGGVDLGPETYAETGNFTYQREVAASLLGGDTVRVDFRVDKSFQPGNTDLRDLSIIVSSAALEAK